jgi:hypothetical protein
VATRISKADAARLGIVIPAPRATIPAADAMNGLERRYAGHLELRRLAGEIWRYDYEAVKFRLADNAFYTPDFVVYLPDGVIEIHEVKGGLIREDAALKIRLMAELHPFPVRMVRWKNRAWEFTDFHAKRR